MTGRELPHYLKWWYPLVRPRYDGEPRNRWIADLAWQWLLLFFTPICLIVCSPFIFMSWLADVEEEGDAKRLEQKRDHR